MSEPLAGVIDARDTRTARIRRLAQFGQHRILGLDEFIDRAVFHRAVGESDDALALGDGAVDLVYVLLRDCNDGQSFIGA